MQGTGEWGHCELGTTGQGKLDTRSSTSELDSSTSELRSSTLELRSSSSELRSSTLEPQTTFPTPLPPCHSAALASLPPTPYLHHPLTRDNLSRRYLKK